MYKYSVPGIYSEYLEKTEPRNYFQENRLTVYVVFDILKQGTIEKS